jgi:hypothetical protein
MVAEELMKSRILCSVISLCLVCAAANTVHGTIIDISLQGTAGMGLLGGNENPPVAGGGSGGEVGSGILFDTVTLQLMINIAWGSGNGFTNLTGNATAGHIHGPTADPAPISFTENAPVWIPLDSLPGWNPSATNGGLSGTVPLTAEQATALQEGRLYINVHTSVNPGGEIRGYLIVPEPATLALLTLGTLSILPILRRARK